MLEFLMMGSKSVSPAIGQVVFTTNNTWVVPANVTKISAVAVGAGGSAGGGGLSWRNNIIVSPGQILTIAVSGNAEIRNAQSAIMLIAMQGVAGGGYKTSGGGGAGGKNANAINDGGGNGGGGSGNDACGGGAGGYSGAGGYAHAGGFGPGAGGGGAGGQPGGGVGLLGEGFSGTAFGQAGSVVAVGQLVYGGGRSSGGGAIRIIYGSNRNYPSTNVLDM